ADEKTDKSAGEKSEGKKTGGGKNDEKKKGSPGDLKKKKKNKRTGGEEGGAIELRKEWGGTFKGRWEGPGREGGRRGAGAPAELPEKITWHGGLRFLPTAGSEWHALFERAKEPVAVERKFGEGSVVLIGDAYCLSNEAMDKDRATGFLS